MKKISLCLVLLLLVSAMQAKHLGNYGQTFPITETDLLELIQYRWKALAESGGLKQWEADTKAHIKQKILRPTPTHLPVTQTPHIFHYTPSFTLDQDVTDHTGVILYKKGLTINPLDISTYPKTLQRFNPVPVSYQMILIFINGDDKAQVRWLQHKLITLKALKQRYRVLLINGNIHETTKYLDSDVRFDQGGFLSHTFGLKAVPSVVTLNQQKARFDITEIGMHALKSIASIPTETPKTNAAGASDA